MPLVSAAASGHGWIGSPSRWRRRALWWWRPVYL